MSDTSAIPLSRLFDARQGRAKSKATAEDASLPAISPSGPRKLVRPPMPAGALAKRVPFGVSPLSSVRPNARESYGAGVRGENSHAEAFYFQKQIHSQTLMVFVLEEDEEVEGQIEWYDRDAIKVRHGNLRTLIYKSSIKYLYKAADRAL